MLAKNIEELIKLYNTYFATTNAIMDTSKNHLSIDANTIRWKNTVKQVIHLVSKCYPTDSSLNSKRKRCLFIKRSDGHKILKMIKLSITINETKQHHLPPWCDAIRRTQHHQECGMLLSNLWIWSFRKRKLGKMQIISRSVRSLT